MAMASVVRFYCVVNVCRINSWLIQRFLLQTCGRRLQGLLELESDDALGFCLSFFSASSRCF